MQRDLGFLFGSDTRAKLLAALLDLTSPASVSELAAKAEVDVGAAHRELAKLAEIKLVDIAGTQPVYSINSLHPVYVGIKEIFKASRRPEKRYFFFAEMVNAYPLMICSFMNVDLANGLFRKKAFISRLTNTLVTFEHNNGNLYLDPVEYSALSQEIVDRIFSDPDFGIADNNYVIGLSGEFLALADEIGKLNYSAMSNKQLLAAFQHFFHKQEILHVSGWIQNSADMVHMPFTNKLTNLLKKKISESGKKLSSAEVFSKLTTPIEKSFMQIEHEDLLRLLLKISSDEKLLAMFKTQETRHILQNIKGTKMGTDISNHAGKYGWLGYGYVGPNWGESYFVDILSSLARQGADAEKLLKEEENKLRALKEQQNALAAQLQFNQNQKKLFEVARGIVFAKGYRKDSMFKYFSRIEHLYGEISKRLYVPLNDLRFAYPNEMPAIIAGKFNLGILRKRRDFTVIESFGSYDSDKLIEGQAARKYLEKLTFEKEELPDRKLLTGNCATPGRVRGIVKIINLTKDIPKMNKGDILVSIATMPDLVSAMKKAGAIVTDTGGLTCHAAIVSRELNIPCIVGTKFATRIFKDGDLVDVDATHGVVKKL